MVAARRIAGSVRRRTDDLALDARSVRRDARVAGALLLLSVAVALGACRRNTYAPPPPPEVTVTQPVEREVTTYSEFTGHTVAVQAIDIRARVQGFLQSINFAPGSDVKQGDLLFVIEPALYEARVQQAEADLANAEAASQAAESQLAITRAIFERAAGSKTELVQRTQARDQAHAAVDQARATLAAAKLDLSYTHIYAPISGRIDRNLVDVGNLVGAGQATLLASIVQQQPIYAYFDASERDLLRYRALRRRGETAAAEGERNKAYLGLVTEDGFPHVGEVDYASNRVDPETGTIELRAIFPNPDGVLLPGLFVRVRLPFTRGPAMLIPDVAVAADQGGRYVLVVGANDTVEQRRVKLGTVVDQMRIVDGGLHGGDWVVVNGIQRARPGSVVKPTRVAPGTTTVATDGTPAGGDAAAPDPAAPNDASRDGAASQRLDAGSSPTAAATP